MPKKITLLIDSIITPYEIARYNAINEVLSGNLIVWFQAETDSNRHWKELPKPNFKFEVLKDRPIRLVGKDIHTFHINPEVLKKLGAIKNDLEKVIICGWDSLTYWQAAYYCKRNLIPFTVWSGSTVHEKSWRRVVFMPIIKWIIKNASEYIAYGTRAKKFLHTLGAPLDKIKIFYNSVDVEYFSEKAVELAPRRDSLREKLSIAKSDYVFLYIGQLITRKGIRDLLSAFSSQTAHIKLMVIGTGPLDHLVKEAQVATKPGQITYLPHLEYFELPQYYVMSDCLILPSHEEVWGLVVNEALASGVPVIASDAVGATDDLIFNGKTGYTYEAKNISSLLNRMKQVVSRGETMKEASIAVAMKTHPKTMAIHTFSGSNQ